MKKKLEAELISIAHRILKLKHKDDVVQLHQEAQKLYEKLSILRFYEENFEALKPTLTHEELDEKIEAVYGEREVAAAEISEEVQQEPVAQETEKAAPEEAAPVVHTTEEIPVEDEKILVGLVDIGESDIEEEEEEEPVVYAEEPLVEDIAEAGEDSTEIEIPDEPIKEEEVAESKDKPKQISFADLLGDTYKEPDFVKVNAVPSEVQKATNTTFERSAPAQEVMEAPSEKTEKDISVEKTESRPMSLNEKFNKTITLGLNDRIAFEKHLFGGSGEDLNRVLSQLNTMNNLQEARDFIQDLVKPDYNNWKGKDEFSSRFMEMVENKFA